ncbi:MAG: sulfide/dihydroorotate dehydrogenase-like FAD/NAD-binding protein [Planctomycetota bacterium]
MFKILDKREVAPNTFEIVVEAPLVARKAQPGQFVIVMVDEFSERIPYTLCDWDAKSGTITLTVLEMGKSSRKIAMCRAGDCILNLVGPLGIPLAIEHFGDVVLAGGCYGIGAITCIAKAMREAGNRVTCIAEARSHYVQYYKDKLERLCAELIRTTADGSEGVKGHASDVIAAKLKKGERIDLVVAVGCPFMMRIVSDETREKKVKTLVALNPIMVDGTGMCGACRVTVGNKTKFACVDGPFFDGHEVDWSELRDRKAAYSEEEILALGDSAPVMAPSSAPQTLLTDAARICRCP